MTDGQLLSKIKDLYRRNHREMEGNSYTIPSADTYPYQWYWDSCFAAITLSYFDVPRAKAELRSLTSRQFENGMIPHIIYWQHVDNLPQLDMRWGKRRTSSITQPPFLAEAVNKIYARDGDIEFVREMLPHIHRLHQFLYRQRDPRKSGLVGIINPDESGEDTSPRFDGALRLGNLQTFEENYGARLELVQDWREARYVVKQRMDLKHWVRDVPFNAVLVESLNLTARLGVLAGDNRLSDWSSAKADHTAHVMKGRLKDDNGYFWATVDYGDQERKIIVRTWALFASLYAGLNTHDESEELVRILLDLDDFSTPYGVPTVSLTDDSFNLDSVWPWPNWRGPIWFVPHWMICKGLRRYGYNEQADKLKLQSRSLIEKSGFREFYNPFSGEGYGAKDFIWGGLLLDM